MKNNPNNNVTVALKYLELIYNKGDEEVAAMHCYVNGKFYKNFGDQYHNKAYDRAETFEETLTDLGYFVTIKGKRKLLTKKDEEISEQDGDLAELLGFSAGDAK